MSQRTLSPHLLQQVLDVLPEAVLIADATPTFILSNRAANGILGMDVAGGSVPMFGDGVDVAFGAKHLDGRPFPANDLPLERALLRGEVVRGEQLLLRNARTGHDIPVLANSAPLRDAAGAIAGAVVIFQDITAIKELERARQESLSSASHDLKGPLTGIRGFAQLALRRLRRLDHPDASLVAAQIEQIESAATRMQGLINDLLDATRQQVDQPLALDRQPTDLVALLKRIVRTQQPAGEERIEFHAESESVEGIWDPTRLDRMFTNLIANAVKYSPNAPIWTTVTCKEVSQGSVAIVTVEDRGIGIPAADLPHIFERYYRAANVAGRLPGNGIGLASTREIVEQHGGTIEARSTEHEGSTFTVTLPLQSEPKIGSR